MSKLENSKNEDKAVEIIKIIDGLSQEKINNIFSIVNDNITKGTVKKIINKSLEENVIIHT